MGTVRQRGGGAIVGTETGTEIGIERGGVTGMTGTGGGLGPTPGSGITGIGIGTGTMIGTATGAIETEAAAGKPKKPSLFCALIRDFFIALGNVMVAIETGQDRGRLRLLDSPC